MVLISASCINSFVNTQPVAASTEAARWTRVNIPAEGEAGSWALADGSDIRHLTAAANGTLYAYGAGLTYTLLKSADGGLKWSCTGKVQDVITGIAVSPQDANAIYYATEASVYRSSDSGKSFVRLPAVPGGVGTDNIEITSIAVEWLYGNIVAVGTRDTDSLQYGGVYIYDESTVIPAWTDTGIGSYDVYDVAFSPAYSSDRQITAAATDETDTYIFSKIGNADWSAFIGSAKLNRDNTAPPTPVAIKESAVIAFPDNYSAEIGTSECVFYAGIDTGAGLGDVYKITCMDAPSASIAADLDTGGRYGSSNTDITGLSVYGGGGTVIVLAAAAAQTYTSTDGGVNWTRSPKPPTGDADTDVLLSHDFSATGVMYAVTSGTGSALSVSRDLGETWNQVSLVDTKIDSIVDIAPSPEYRQDNTLFMITFGAGPSSGGLWRTTDGGLSWERTLSGALPAVDVISRIGLPPQYGNDCRTIFAAGESGGNPVIWKSEDGGQSFRTRLTRDPVTGTAFPIDAWAIADENTLFIGSYDGAQGLIYRTSNGGFSFAEGTPAGTNSIYSIALSPDYDNDGTILVGNSNGKVYKSGDGGAAFVMLPPDTTSVPLSDCIDVAFDPEFRENGVIYASSSDIDAGFYRFNTGTGDYWESIDGTLPADAAINRLAVSGGGVLYGINADTDGGMERCLNPRATGPVFETVTLGLSAGATLSGIRLAGDRIWAIDTTNCKLMVYTDKLVAPVIQTSPENNAAGIGSLTDHAVKNITLDWEAAEGAASYEYQCNFNTDAAAIPSGLEGTVTSSSVHLPPLDPATVYYWRVRAATPVLSPWSDWWSFTTGLDTEIVSLKPESPAAGATGVPVRPVFQWTAVVGASSYELLLAADAEFEDPVIVRINEYALPTNAWECDVNLDYDTTYYWKVRAVTASTHSTWSSAGVFTTGPLPSLDEKAGEEAPESGLPDRQDSPMMLSPPVKITSPEKLLTPPAAPPPTPQVPEVSQLPTIPNWMIYFTGGLLAIVMLALIIVLVAVLKIKRF